MNDQWSGLYAGKTFSNDWISHNFAVWDQCLAADRGKVKRVLEIGSWEGRSAIFFLEYFQTATITCIDTFAGSPEHTLPEQVAGTEGKFDANLAPYRARVTKIKATSAAALAELSQTGERFDLVYIDGAHDRANVMVDSILAWGLLNEGGFAIWDDYVWGRGEVRIEDRPEQAIYVFAAMERQRMEILHRKVQLIVRKVAERPQRSSFREMQTLLGFKCLTLPHYF